MNVTLYCLQITELVVIDGVDKELVLDFEVIPAMQWTMPWLCNILLGDLELLYQQSGSMKFLSLRGVWKCAAKHGSFLNFQFVLTLSEIYE